MILNTYQLINLSTTHQPLDPINHSSTPQPSWGNTDQPLDPILGKTRAPGTWSTISMRPTLVRPLFLGALAVVAR